MTVRGVKKKHHRMTPIEHFFTDIMHISLSDWIEISIADIGREVARLIFVSWHCTIFFKNSRWPIKFVLTAEEVFFFWCCIKIVQCRSARFFCASWNDVLFLPNWHVPIYSARKTLAHLGKKIFFTDIYRKKWQSTDVGQERWPYEV